MDHTGSTLGARSTTSQSQPTSVAEAIRQARLARGWKLQRVADEASSLPGAPFIDLDKVHRLEHGRFVIRLADDEPLLYVMVALGVPITLLLRAMGLERAKCPKCKRSILDHVRSCPTTQDE